MTKKELFNNTMEAVKEYAEGKMNAEVKAGLFAVIEAELAPKTSGTSIDVDAVTNKDGQGNIVEMQCSLSGVFLPATEDYFYKDSKGEGFQGTGLIRTSILGKKAKNDHDKVIRASKAAITEDVMNEVLTPAEGKAEIEKLLGGKVDYSSVVA